MATLQQQIDEIEAKLNSGVKKVTADGQTTEIDHDALRRRLSQLYARKAAQSGCSPIQTSQLNMGHPTAGVR